MSSVLVTVSRLARERWSLCIAVDTAWRSGVWNWLTNSENLRRIWRCTAADVQQWLMSDMCRQCVTKSCNWPHLAAQYTVHSTDQLDVVSYKLLYSVTLKSVTLLTFPDKLCEPYFGCWCSCLDRQMDKQADREGERESDTGRENCSNTSNTEHQHTFVPATLAQCFATFQPDNYDSHQQLWLVQMLRDQQSLETQIPTVTYSQHIEIEQGLMTHQTHYRSYQVRDSFFTGQMTQPTVSKHWRNIQNYTKPNRTKHQNPS